MKKYAGLTLVVVMCAATAMAYGFTKTATASPAHSSEHEGDVMLKTLDLSLATKLKDYWLIIDRLQKLSDATPAAKLDNKVRALSGDKAAPRSTLAKLKPGMPWWSGYELNMVVYSDEARSAAVNGQFVREGDAVRADIIVKAIASQSVTLARQNDTKTLFVKSR